MATDAKIVVFGCGIEASATEAKGTVLMKNADDLKNYNKSEEKKMEEIISFSAKNKYCDIKKALMGFFYA